MRVSKKKSNISLLTAIGITAIVMAQLQAGCFKEVNSNCADWYTSSNPFPYGVVVAADCTQNVCGCSGNPAIPAGPANPSDCGCIGIATVHINTKVIKAAPCAIGEHNDCRDNWTIKTKANGELDDVKCGEVRSCNHNCQPQFLLVNGQIQFVQNICGPPGPPNAFYANQAKVVGNPC